MAEMRHGPATFLTLCALGLISTAASAAPISAQEPEAYLRARTVLAEGDTLAAVAELRELAKREPDFAPAWGLLGEILTAKASGIATDFQERLEAERALDRALRLEPENPVYLFTLGRLKRKQQIYLDARRLIDRAIERMQEAPEQLPAEHRAEIWFQRGLFYEDEYLDTRHLVFAPNLPVSSLCGMPVFCINFTDPRKFNAELSAATDLSSYGDDDYERTTEAFEKALEAHPAHDGAFRRLAIHWIDRGELDRVIPLASRYRQRAPASPWGDLVAGLAHQRSGADSIAEAAFHRGLELASDELRSHYESVSRILPRDQAKMYESANEIVRRQLEEILWRKSDPLYLSSENEVRLAHWARVTYADIMFEDPSTGAWGSETERGITYVRYGPPRRIWQIHRDLSKEMTNTEADLPAEASRQGGGRWIFWNYGSDLPNFVFGKQLRYRRASHLIDSYSKTWEEELRHKLPAHYAVAFRTTDYPVQVARFKGDHEQIVELDLYSEAPIRELRDEVHVDSVEVGLFVFAEPRYTPVYERTLPVPARADRQPITYSVAVPPGRYTLSLEARSPAGNTAARHRETIEARPFPDGVLSLSDLVFAESITPMIDEPRSRRDFALDVNRRLEFERETSVAVYWEIYGLSFDQDAVARYRVTLSVQDAEGDGVLAGVARALRGVFGGGAERGLKITYESTVALAGDRVPDFVALDFAPQKTGPYRLRVEVTDLASGETATAERLFTVAQGT